MIITKQKSDNIQKFLSSLMSKTHLINSITVDAEESFNSAYTPEEEEWLSLANLSSSWAEAVDPSLIAQTEEDKQMRAESILSLFANNVNGKRMCDFDCNEGHLVQVAVSEGASLAVGLDVFGSKITVPDNSNQIFTKDIEEVKRNAPYDVIFMYDFLDHVEDPISYLVIARDCLKNDGRIYVRFHPWCSRHGGHTYKKINKAYIHFFLGEEALSNLNDGKPCPQRVIHPLNTYDSWIKGASLVKVEKEVVITQPVEAFFKTPKPMHVVAKNYFNSPNGDFRSGRKFPDAQMSMQFLDYILAKK